MSGHVVMMLRARLIRTVKRRIKES